MSICFLISYFDFDFVVCLESNLFLYLYRYVNGHAKKHFEETQAVGVSQKKSEKQEKDKYHHSVCMDSSNYSVFW